MIQCSCRVEVSRTSQFSCCAPELGYGESTPHFTLQENSHLYGKSFTAHVVSIYWIGIWWSLHCQETSNNNNKSTMLSGRSSADFDLLWGSTGSHNFIMGEALWIWGHLRLPAALFWSFKLNTTGKSKLWNTCCIC